MPAGTIIKQFGAFKVTDDGINNNLYGVWVQLTVGGDKLIGSGMKLANATMVAEALNRVNAGNVATTLTESGKTIA